METSYRLARTRVKMNAQRINRFEFPFYEELVNVRTKRYQLLLEMYAEVRGRGWQGRGWQGAGRAAG